MNDLNQKLLELNEEIVNTFSVISNIKPHSWHMFFNSQYKLLENSLFSFRKRLNEIDREIEPHTIIPNQINDLNMASGKLSILFATRGMTLTSLSEAQKLLTNSQTQVSFKFTTLISLLAIVLSVYSVYLGSE